MAKPSRKIKLSKNLKPFVSRVVRNGIVQDKFRQLHGNPMKTCMKPQMKFGMTPGEIRGVLAGCAKTTKFGGNFIAMDDPNRRRKVYDRRKGQEAKKGK